MQNIRYFDVKITSLNTGKISELKISDIVLINDDKLQRHFWRPGRLVAVFPSR